MLPDFEPYVGWVKDDDYWSTGTVSVYSGDIVMVYNPTEDGPVEGTVFLASRFVNGTLGPTNRSFGLHPIASRTSNVIFLGSPGRVLEYFGVKCKIVGVENLSGSLILVNQETDRHEMESAVLAKGLKWGKPVTSDSDQVVQEYRVMDKYDIAASLFPRC